MSEDNVHRVESRPKRKPTETFEFTPSNFQVPKQDITEQKIDNTFKFSWEKEAPSEAAHHPTASPAPSHPAYPPTPPIPPSPSADGFKRFFKKKILGIPILALLLIGVAAGSVGGYAVTSNLFGAHSGCQYLGLNANAINNVTLTNYGSVTAVVTDVIVATDGSLWEVPSWNAVRPLNVAPSSSAWLYYGNTMSAGNSTVTLTVRENSEVHFCQYTVFYHTIPQPPKENIFMESSPSFTSSTNVTVYIRNAGSVSVTLVTYYVKDSSGNSWANTQWNGGTLQPNQVQVTLITIGSSCPSCTYSGSPNGFNGFQSGYSYTVTVVTARNDSFSFSVTR